MYCWNCGKEMEDGLLFCPHCAIKQAGIPEPKPGKKLPLLPIVCAVVCGLVLLSLALLLMLPEGGSAKPVDPYSVELPDLASFLNTRYDHDDVSAYTHYVICILRKDPGREAVQEFVELLQEDRYQLVLDDSREYSQSKALCRDYIFHYTGKNEGIEWVHHVDGYRYHVKLSVSEHLKKDQLTVTLYTAPGFDLADPGVDAAAVK